MRANEIGIKTAKTSKVTAVVLVMSVFCKKGCNLRSANPKNKKAFLQKMESTDFLEENCCGRRNLSQKQEKAGYQRNKHLNRRN
jgi:hypothetical protein